MADQGRQNLMRFVPLAKRLLAVAIATLCVWSIWHALRGQTPETIASAFASIPPRAIIVAFTLVATNFLVMSGMEMLALRDAGVVLPYRRALTSAFIGNALSVAAGLGPISGAGVRTGLFRGWGLSAQTAAATAVSTTVMSLCGGAMLAALGLTFQPEAIAAVFGAPGIVVRALGAGVLIAALVAIIGAGRKRNDIKLFGFAISIPSAGGAAVRLSLGALDWIISANILYAFLSPNEDLAPLSFVGAFASAHFAGMAVGAPAGLGVFDALMLRAGLDVTTAQMAVSLLLYRLVAYVTPALLALGPFVAMSQRPAAQAQ